MTQISFTPGPWEHGDSGLIYGQCGENDVEAPFVCDVIEDSAMQVLGMLSPVEETNARLIAAAPAQAIILDLLQHGLATIGAGELEFVGVMYWFDDQNSDWTAVVDAIGWDKARAAIIQGKGGCL
jgi:hypothetical protein